MLAAALARCRRTSSASACATRVDRVPASSRARRSRPRALVHHCCAAPPQAQPERDDDAGQVQRAGADQLPMSFEPEPGGVGAVARVQ